VKEQNKKHKTKVSEIWIDDEGIMHVEFARGVELSLEDMEEGYAIFRELGVGPGMRKSRQLLSGGPFTISREAREFAGRSGKDYFVAAAMISDSIVMRFVIHIFNTLQKHDVPFRMFSNEEEAVAWLRTFDPH
jgi:hypothetical protein